MTDGRASRRTRASSVRRTLSAIAAVSALGGLVAACADDDSGDAGEGGSAATTTVGSGGGDTVDPPEETPVESSTTPPPSPPPSAPATAPSTLPEQSGEEGGWGDEPVDPLEPRPPLLNADGRNDAYTGIAQVAGLGSTCTGFVLDVGDEDGTAWMMTNGHCVGLFDATTVLTDSPAPSEAIARFHVFEDTPGDVFDVGITTVVYGSMRATDVAIVALDTTRAELAERGVAAYSLGEAPASGETIRVVGIPATGVDPDAQVLRGGECRTGRIVGLVEWEWRWDLALDSDCKGILGGNSGSPVFASDDPTTVVGIVNTTTIGAAEGGSCFLGQPCEITPGRVVERRNRTYAMPVGEWGRCWTGAGLDLDAPGCPAERAPFVRVDAPLRAVQAGARWGATISVVGEDGSSVDDVAVLTKMGPAGATDCRSADGYTELNGGAPPVAFNEPLPEEEGIYVLCAAITEPDGQARVSTAGYAVMEVDVTPPVGETQLSVVRLGAETRVDPIFAVPERSDFQIKFGPEDETDCDDAEGYLPYRRVPVTIPNDMKPARVCVIATDEAGNSAAPEQFTVD